MELNAYIIPGLEIHRPLDAMNVEKLVCQTMGLEPERMQASKKYRGREYADARFVVFYILVRQFGWKLAETGRTYGKHHTTVIHGMKKVEALMEVDKEFRKKVSSIIDI